MPGNMVVQCMRCVEMENEMNLKVKRATVLLSKHSSDHINLELDMPTPFPTMGYPAHATIQAEAGCGVQWVKDNLGMEAEVIDKDNPVPLTASEWSAVSE